MTTSAARKPICVSIVNSAPTPCAGHLAHTSVHPPEYRAGFLDGIGAFVSMVLEGCQINPETWEVLSAIERAGESQ